MSKLTRITVLCLGHLALLGAPGAQAADVDLCVVLGGVSPDDQPIADACSGSYASVDAALAAIVGLADIDDGSGPRRPAVQITVVPDSDGQNGSLPGPINGDLSSPSTTPDLGVHFGAVPICGGGRRSPRCTSWGARSLWFRAS